MIDAHETGLRQDSAAFRRVTVALFIGGLATYASLYTTQSILPLISATLDVNPVEASLTVSAATATLAISMLVAGAVADAVGRKPIMAAALGAAGAIGILAAVAPNFAILLVLRALEGLVLAGLPATAMAYLAEEIHPSSLGVAMGLYISGNSIGGMAGRVISGAIADQWGWRSALGVIGVMSLICAVWFGQTLPHSRHFQRRALNLAAVLGALLGPLRDAHLRYLYAVSFLLMGSYVTLYNYIGYDLMAPPYSLSATLVSWIFLLYLVGTFSSTWMGQLSDRYGRPRVLSAAVAIMLAGALITQAEGLVVKILGIAVFTFGFFGGHSIASSTVGARSKPHAAPASSLYLFFYYLGSSVAGTSGGALYLHYGWQGVVALIAGLLLLALAAVRSVARTALVKR